MAQPPIATAPWSSNGEPPGRDPVARCRIPRRGGRTGGILAIKLAPSGVYVGSEHRRRWTARGRTPWICLERGRYPLPAFVSMQVSTAGGAVRGRAARTATLEPATAQQAVVLNEAGVSWEGTRTIRLENYETALACCRLERAQPPTTIA